MINSNQKEDAKDDETTNTVKEDIFKRLDQRKENLQLQRSANAGERSKNAAGLQDVLDKLHDWSNDILTRIEASNAKNTIKDGGNELSIMSPETTADVLASLSEEIQKFDSFFNEKSNDLSPYDVRQTQAVTVQIKEKFVILQDSLKPKKKFGFKSKHKKNTGDASNISQMGNDTTNCIIQDNLPTQAVQPLARENRSYEVINPNCQNLIDVSENAIRGRDVIMNSLRQDNYFEKITVKIFGSPGTLHATNMENVTVLCGPVRTSIFVENCSNCTFVVACQQLRIHTTKNSNFYLHVTSKGIIEDCNSVAFAPYNLSYPNLHEHLSNSGLNLKVNNWDKIDDFNWLSTEKSSPNWNILPENQRKENWLL